MEAQLVRTLEDVERLRVELKSARAHTSVLRARSELALSKSAIAHSSCDDSSEAASSALLDRARNVAQLADLAKQKEEALARRTALHSAIEREKRIFDSEMRAPPRGSIAAQCIELEVELARRQRELGTVAELRNRAERARIEEAELRRRR